MAFSFGKPVLFLLVCVQVLLFILSPENKCSCQPNQAASSGSLQLNIKINKPTYVVGEPIVVSVDLRNTGTEPKAGMWFSYDNGFYFDVRDAEDKRVILEYAQAEKQHFITSWQRTTAPSASVKTQLDLVVGDVVEHDFFFPRGETSQEPQSDLFVPRFLIGTGSYKLVVIQNVKDILGQLTPLTVTKSFTVRQPTAQEKGALGLLKWRSNPEAEQAYRELYSRYGKTPYAPYALYYVGRILQTRGSYSEAADTYRRLLKTFPKFALRADAVYYLASSDKRAGRIPEARAALQVLKAEFPNQLIGPTVRYPSKVSRIDQLTQEITGADH